MHVSGLAVQRKGATCPTVLDWSVMDRTLCLLVQLFYTFAMNCVSHLFSCMLWLVGPHSIPKHIDSRFQFVRGLQGSCVHGESSYLFAKLADHRIVVKYGVGWGGRSIVVSECLTHRAPQGLSCIRSPGVFGSQQRPGPGIPGTGCTLDPVYPGSGYELSIFRRSGTRSRADRQGASTALLLL
jgi:hypothetical protein